MYADQWVLRLVTDIVIFLPSQMIWADMGISKNKSETFEKFKQFQSEVENHCNKKIKFLWSDHGGEYLSYEFGLHLKQCGIVSQLTPPGTPQRNGVSERHNRTLLDMVRSMMSLTNLSLSFWGLCIRDNCIHFKQGTIKVRWDDTIWTAVWQQT